MELIRKFFVVTKTSIYTVCRDDEDVVSATKKKDGAIVGRLPPSLYLGITQKGMFFYTDAGTDVDVKYIDKKPISPEDLPPEKAPQRLREKKTSSVVGLFLSHDDAMMCLASNRRNPMEWAEQTKKVIRLLKDDPIIRVSRDPEIGFPADFFE